MLSIERRKKILSWLHNEETLSIAEISKRLKVSEMTVYRDIKPLMNEKEIIKTAGGISLVPTTQLPVTACSYCLKEANNRHPVQIITHDLRVEQLCCPHCGLLRYHDIEKDVSQIICRDFLQKTTISAKTAYYLIDTDFQLNCCQPQVLAFDSLKHAEQFQTGFGGMVLRFEQAIKEVRTRMNAEDDCHCL